MLTYRLELSENSKHGSVQSDNNVYHTVFDCAKCACVLFIFVFLYFPQLSGFMLISANYLLAVAVYLVYKHQAQLVFSFKSLQESTKTHSHHVKLLLWCFYQ